MGKAELNVVDLVIFTLTLAIPAVVGIYHAYRARRQSGTVSYLLAGRKMRTLPVSLSSFATTISTIAFVGYPAEAYTYGFQIAFAGLGFVLSIPITAYVFLPVFYNLKCTSVFEFLSVRFSPMTRKMCSILFVFLMTFYISVIIYGTTAVLTYVTPLDTWTAATLLCLVCTFYTTLGGMKAVIWTDFLQAFIMFATMFFIAGKGISDVGGFQLIWEANNRGQRLDVSFDLNPFKRLTIWTVTFGIFFVSLVHNNANQIVIQRYFSCPSLKIAQRTVIVSSFISAIVLFIFSFVGLVLYTAYEHCDPLLEGAISSRNQLVPLFLVRLAGSIPGLTGLIVAGMCSAALSTLSSACNSLAAIILEDMIKPRLSTLSERKALCISRGLSGVYGIICLGFVAVASTFPNVLPAATQALNIICAPLLGIFLVGILFPCCSSLGINLGFIAGLIVSLWISLGTMLYNPYIPTLPLSVAWCNASSNISEATIQAPILNFTSLNITESIASEYSNNEEFSIYKLSYMLHGPLAFFVTLVISLIASWLSGRNNPVLVHHSLISPLALKFYQWAPNCIKSLVGYKNIHFPSAESSSLVKAPNGVEKIPEATNGDVPMNDFNL